jgi:4-amino-4-deoxy-L-arabinose transferase-like glycosyltransferase
LYARTLPPSLGGTLDSPEFQQAAYSLAVAHPTGYPLYLLTGRAWITLFPIGDPAYRMNFLSAVFAALAVWVLYALVRHITGSTAAAIASAALYAVLPIPWSQASVAEVNSLHTLLVGLSFLAVALWTRGQIALPVMALVLGCALSHHRTALLYVPVLALYALFARWRMPDSIRVRWTEIALSVLLLLLPLATYVYLPLRAYTTPWYTNTWAGFLEHAAGESALSMMDLGTGGALLGRIRQLLTGQVFNGPQGAVFFVLGLVGLSVLAFSVVRGWRARLGSAGAGPPVLAFDEVKLGTAGVAVLAFALGIAFASVYQIFDIVDYLGVPVFMWGVITGLAFAAMLKLLSAAISRLGSRAESVAPRRIAQGLVLLVALLLTSFTASQSLANKGVRVDYSNLDRQGYWKTVKQELESAPGGTILIGDWQELNEVLYLQRVEGWRPDLIAAPLDSAYREDGTQVDGWLAEGRQVLLLGRYESVVRRFEAEARGPGTSGSQAEGVLWQVTGRKTQTDAPAMAHEVNRRFGSSMLLVGYTLSPETEMQPGDVLNLTLYWQATERVYERYTVFTHVLDARGDKVGQKDDEPQRGFKPTVLWQRGETIVDAVEIQVSSTAAPGTYRVVTGMYNSVTQQRLPAYAPDGVALGDYATLTEIAIPAP